MLVSHLICKRHVLIKNFDKCPECVKILCVLCEDKKDFLISYLNTVSEDQVCKERRLNIEAHLGWEAILVSYVDTRLAFHVHFRISVGDAKGVLAQ